MDKREREMVITMERQTYRYRCAPLFKVCIMLLCFYERPISACILANGKIPEEDFHFYKKR